MTQTKAVELTQMEIYFILNACEYFSENNSIGGIYVRNHTKKFSNEKMEKLENKLRSLK